MHRTKFFYLRMAVTEHSPLLVQFRVSFTRGLPASALVQVCFMIKSVLSMALFGAALSCLPMVSANAGGGQVLTVEVDESQILQLPATPGAIVIGNPSIADVSIQGQKIFVHGRGFGQTNLTILDLEGNQIANFSLIGVHAQPSSVVVFRGPERFSYSCVTNCEAEVQVGDNNAFMNNVTAQLNAKMGLATGTKSSESQAPQAAPQ
jgi:Pilus formation protein N terminal region